MNAPRFLLNLKRITLDEVDQVHGFMRLLMKERNGAPWSEADKVAILAHLRHFGRSLPYLALFTIPGATLLLPGLAWFLDRRKYRNSGIPTPREETSLVSLPLRPTEDEPDHRV